MGSAVTFHRYIGFNSHSVLLLSRPIAQTSPILRNIGVAQVLEIVLIDQSHTPAI